MKATGITLLLATTLFISSSQAQIEGSNRQRESAHLFVITSAERAHAGIMQRDEFRDQIKVLAMTIFFVIMGIALSKDAKDIKLPVLLVAILVVLFLYGIDTSLLDLSNRQGELGAEINRYLVRWDSLSDAQIDSALVVAQRKVDDSSFWGKLSLAFCDFRAIDQFWYVIPVIVGTIIWIVQKKK